LSRPRVNEGVRVVPTDYRGSEWAGSVFEPKNGIWLFVHEQSPAITLAIRDRAHL
jgi:hypothetical protein